MGAGNMPQTRVRLVSEILHGERVDDPYRWLEQDSQETRQWLAAQAGYYGHYLASIKQRDRIRSEVRQLLGNSSPASVFKVGGRYFHRSRHRGEEQASLYFRDGFAGPDQELINPAEIAGEGCLTSVNICAVSRDANLLAYEVRSGGCEAHRTKFLDIAAARVLPDEIPAGRLMGFSFAPDTSGFYYAHQAEEGPLCHRIRFHRLGTAARDDEEIFAAGCDRDTYLTFRSDGARMIIVVVDYGEPNRVDFLLHDLKTNKRAALFEGRTGVWVPLWFQQRILALVYETAGNGSIVELEPTGNAGTETRVVIDECAASITNVVLLRGLLAVSYFRNLATEVAFYDPKGSRRQTLRFAANQTVRIIGQPFPEEELIYESESIAEPRAIYRYLPRTRETERWIDHSHPRGNGAAEDFIVEQHAYTARDSTSIPITLAGKRSVLESSGPHPVIVTSYGGFGVATTPQYSIFSTWLIRHGSILALPNIRGGSEFGSAWHRAAQRHRRQTSFDDLIAAVEWLLASGVASPRQVGIFGGSNSGLLALAAVTQRPELFTACLCIAPLADMLRYHLFNEARRWRDEFGCADDPGDFQVLRSYSPYHNVRDGAGYPAVLFVSGDADGRCHPLHARKMVARMQAASGPDRPILLDYSRHRGHVPALPLSMRIEALANRLSFFARELGLLV